MLDRTAGTRSALHKRFVLWSRPGDPREHLGAMGNVAFRSSGKAAYQGKPHMGSSETSDAGCWFAVPFAAASTDPQTRAVPGMRVSQKIWSPNTGWRLARIIEKRCMDFLRGSSVRIGSIQRILASPPRKDDMHTSRSVSNHRLRCINREAICVYIYIYNNDHYNNYVYYIIL